MWWLWGVLMAGMLCHGGADSTEAPASPVESNEFSVILTTDGLVDGNGRWTEEGDTLTKFLGTRNIPYDLVTLTDDPNAQVVPVVANLMVGNKNITMEVTLSDVTGDLRKGAGPSRGKTSSYLLIDRCSGMRQTLVQSSQPYNELFDYPLLNNSFYGYFVNFTTLFDSVANTYHALTFTRAILKNMTVGHAYFVVPNSPIDSLTRVNTSNRLCNGFVINPINRAIKVSSGSTVAPSVETSPTPGPMAVSGTTETEVSISPDSTEENAVSIVLSADAILDTPGGDGRKIWYNLLEYFDHNNISYELVTVVLNQSGAMPVEATFGNKEINRTIKAAVTDVTGDVRFVRYDRIIGFGAGRVPGQRFIMFDRCTGLQTLLRENDEKFNGLFDVAVINSSFYGYFVNFTTDFPTTDSRFGVLPLTRGVKKDMVPSHSYFVTFMEPANETMRGNVSNRFCNGFVILPNTLRAEAAIPTPVTPPSAPDESTGVSESVSPNEEGNTFSIVVRVRNIPGSGMGDWIALIDFLDQQKIDYEVVKIADDKISGRVSMVAPYLQVGNRSLTVNVSLADVTTALEYRRKDVAEIINAARMNETRYILIDRCIGLDQSLTASDTVYTYLFNMMSIRESFFGYFINLTTDFDTSDSKYSRLSVTRAIKTRMSLNHAYLITSDDISSDNTKRVNISNRFCNGFVIQPKAALAAASGSTSEPLSTTESLEIPGENSLSIIISADEILDGGGNAAAEWNNISAIFRKTDVYYDLAILAYERNSQTVPVQANISVENKNVSVKVDVTDVSTGVEYIKGGLGLGTDRGRSRGPRYYMINPCSERPRAISADDGQFNDLFKSALINSNFRGYFVNYSMAFNATDNVYSNLSLTKAIKTIMAPNHSYIIKPDQPLDTVAKANIAIRFCNGFVLQPREKVRESQSTITNETPTNPTTETTPEATTSESVTTREAPAIIASTSVAIMTPEAPSTTTEETRPVPTKPTFIRTPSTAASTLLRVTTTPANVSMTEKSPITTGHAGGIAAAVIIILILLLIIVTCVVFRRRIVNFVRAKVPRARPIISTLGLDRYGTLQNEYDLEEFGTRRP